MLGLLVTGMLVPYNDNDLMSTTSTAAGSPYVIAITRSGITVLPHIINACIFTSAFSAGNSFLFSSSRVLYGLALRGQAPKILAWCTKSGLPMFSIALTGAFAFLAFMNISSGSVTVFNWFVSLSTVGGFLCWLGMNVTYVNFCTCSPLSGMISLLIRLLVDRGLRVQGIDRKKLVYHSNLQPWLAYWGIFWNIIFILVNGFECFWNFTAASFLTACACEQSCAKCIQILTPLLIIADINIPLFAAVYFGWKFYKRTKIWKPEEMDFVTGIPTLEETETPEVPPANFGEKLFDIVF